MPRCAGRCLLAAALQATACQPQPPATPGPSGLLEGEAHVAPAELGRPALLEALWPTDVTVTMFGAERSVTSETERGGHFALRALPGSQVHLMASATAHDGSVLRAWTTLRVPGGATKLTVPPLELHASGLIDGQILTAAGGEASGADVWLRGTSFVVRADARGRFALANVPAGRWDLVARKPGLGGLTLPAVEVIAGKPTALLTPLTLAVGRPPEVPPALPSVRPSPTGGLAGQVVGPDDAPIGRAEVWLEPPTASPAWTDARGAFRLTGVPSGDYALHVAAFSLDGLCRGLAIGDRPRTLLTPLRLVDAFPDVLPTRPRHLDAIDFDLGASPERAGTPALEAGGANYPHRDEPPTGYPLAPDLAAPLVGAARDRAGRHLVQWHAITQRPLPADLDHQIQDIRYALMIETPKAGAWRLFSKLVDTSFDYLPAQMQGHHLRLAAYGNQGSVVVFGDWAYFDL